MAESIEEIHRGLRVTHHMDGPAVVGDVDLATVAALQVELQAALAAAAAPAPIVLDLTAVEFLGSAGLAAITETYRLAEAAQTPLRLVATQRAVLRPIELTGLASSLTLYATVPDALAAAGSADGDTGPPAAG